MSSALRMRLAIVSVMLTASAVTLVWSSRPARPTTSVTDGPSVASPPPTAPTELDGRIEAQLRFAETSRSWVDWDVAASLLMDRAASGGGLEDLSRASDALDRAFAMADPGAGPHLRRAVIDFRLHRLDACETMLELVDGYAVVSPRERDTVRALRADVAFFRGDYAAARAAYEAALATERDAAGLFSLARLEWSTGHLDRAAALLDEADASADASMRGFLALARTHFLRERGDLPGAMESAARALALRPADDDAVLLFAELRLDTGETAPAEALVSRVLARDATPQAHELAARIARERGDAISAEEHREIATRTYEALFARFPEAIAGHAALHFLRFEDEARAVRMAEANAEARPFGEARARLALAYLRAGRTGDAAREIDAVLASEWSTAESHAIAAEIFASTGEARAIEQARIAEARAPGVTARIGELRAP